MRVTIARLRLGIILLACLLLAALAGFFVYARYRIHRLAKDLPARLGIDIQQTANGFTYSQSSKGHTYFTIHASKLIQYKTGGHATLHDVHITLYGPEGSNRTDKIYGSDFDYDPQAGIASAKGEVQIELAGLAANPHSPPIRQPKPRPSRQTLPRLPLLKRRTPFTSKPAASSSTPKPEMQSPPSTWSSPLRAPLADRPAPATTPKQACLCSTIRWRSQPPRTAIRPSYTPGHAELLRDSRQASLLQPVFDYQSQKSSADQALVYFRKDGSVEHIDAQGHIHVAGQNGSVLTAQTSHVQLDAKSQPVQIDLGGGLNFISNTDNQSMHGNAVEGTLTFGPMSTLRHAQLRNAVSFVDQLLTLPDDPRGNASREVQASKLDIDFAPGADPKKSLAQKALATGNAAVNLHTVSSKGPQQLTNITGDQLLATLENGKTLKQLDGAGHTKIVDLAADGSTNTSTGDRLQVTFAPQVARKPAPAQTANKTAKPATSPGSQNIEVETAIQDGNVVLTQTPVKKPGATTNPATVTAWAKHSEYHAATQTLRLTGDPRLNDGQSLQLAATVLDYHRDSGDAFAEGAVKATYTQPKNQKGTQAAANSGPEPRRRRPRSHHRRSRSVASRDQHQHLLRIPLHSGAHLAGGQLHPRPGARTHPQSANPPRPRRRRQFRSRRQRQSCLGNRRKASAQRRPRPQPDPRLL